jgi:hypothetical protein
MGDDSVVARTIQLSCSQSTQYDKSLNSTPVDRRCRQAAGEATMARVELAV